MARSNHHRKQFLILIYLPPVSHKYKKIDSKVDIVTIEVPRTYIFLSENETFADDLIARCNYDSSLCHRQNGKVRERQHQRSIRIGLKTCLFAIY